MLLIENHLQAIDKIPDSNYWVTLVLLFLFFLIFILKAIDSKRLKEDFTFLIKVPFLKYETDDIYSFFNVYQIVIFLFSTTVISMVIYKFKLNSREEDLAFFTNIFLVVFFYFIAKRILEYLLFSLLQIKQATQFFINSKWNYLYSLTFFLFGGIILFEFTNLKQDYLFYLAVFLFFLRFIFHLVSNKNLIFSKLFYFILYLCAFEIAPLFLLFKLMF